MRALRPHAMIARMSMTRLSRRTVLTGLATAPLLAPLLGCGGAVSAPPTAARAPVAPVANPGFDAWIAAFRPRALAQGIRAETVDRALRGAGFLPGVVERDRNQFHTRRSVEDYIAIATSDERLAMGRAALRKQSSTLNAIAARYGVPAQVVAAIWGVESRFGTRRGDWPVISSLATLAYDGRRGAFFESQLVAALKILDRGDTTPANMVGSWAGAMGHTQFIPTTFVAYAVDFDGDGRRDIWSDDPTDGLASAAAYLNRSGWQAGLPWGVEVAPSGQAPATRYRDASRRSFADWAAAGLRPASGGALPRTGNARLVRPEGSSGPTFLLSDNFGVILRYNNADPYALAVGHLSDRLAGGGPFRTAFGPDASGLTLEQRRRLQSRLKALGYDIGTVDGVIGRNTTAAIEAYQRAQSLPATGTPSPALLARLG